MSTREELQNYWDAAPCEAWHSQYKVGTLEWSNEVRWWRYYVQPHIPGFADFPSWQGKRVLEIGCGIGTDTLQFVKAGATVHAVEYSSRSIALAESRLAGTGAWIDWGDAEMYLPDGPFDLIYSFGVLHHTPHPEKVLWLARQRIAPTGELRIMLYAKRSLKHWTGAQPEAQTGCPLVRWYTGRAARHLVESCGFEVTRIEKRHIFPWRIKEYREGRFVKRWPYRLLPERSERLVGHHLLVWAVPR